MAESEKRIDRLTDRAQEAADRVHASASNTKDKLASQVREARAVADKTTQELQAKAADSEASQRWSAIRKDWHEHIAVNQNKSDTKKQEFDAGRAKHRAERAEDDALDAIDFAYLAIEDAEWAVLDAELARAEANELAATPA
ncbi:MAG: YtxH domain-containing protein [Gaiellaceae bacterium]